MSIPPFTTTSQARLQALYSDISRQKHSNPDAYQANLAWWADAIQAIVSSGSQHRQATDPRRLVFTAGRDLVDILKIKGVGKPLGIGNTVTELANVKTLIPLPAFLSATESIYGPGRNVVRIAKYIVGRPLWWALESLGVVGEDEGVREGDVRWWGDYVVVSLLERAADAVEKRQRSNAAIGPGGSLYTTTSFRKVFGDALESGLEVMSEVDAMVLIRCLERDRKVVVVDGEVVKFIHDTHESREVTAVDRGILELVSAVEVTRLQVDSIQHRIEEHTRSATLALRENRKPIALSRLRAKKHLEDLLTKRLASLHTLEGTLLQVEAAAGDIAIMKSYESSTTTLRSILAHPSLQRDKIEETMDALAEANSEARDVGDLIHSEMDATHEVDDLDVEEELQALVREVVGDEKKRADEVAVNKVRDRLDGLKVPQAVPTPPLAKREDEKVLA